MTSTFTKFFITSKVKSSIINNSFSLGKSLHGLTIKVGFYPEPIISNHLLNLYCKFHKLDYAHKMFDEMTDKNLISYSTLITSNSRLGDPKLALNLVSQLSKLDFAPNQFVFSSAVSACSKLGSIALGQQVHSQIIVSGFQSDPFVCTTLVDMYSKSDYFELSVSVFKWCSTVDSALVNSMMTCYEANENHKEALMLLNETRRNFEFKPTEYSFGSLSKACSGLCVEVGEQLHGLILKLGFDSNCVIGTSLVDMYGEFGEIESMQKVFDTVVSIDIALHNAMIVSLLKNGLNEIALTYLNKLISQKLNPNECTFSSLLKACSGLKHYKFGKMVHGVILKSKFNQDMFVTTALTDMYMKCGKIEQSCKLFDGMHERSTISYNSMISGHGQNGNFHNAISLFIEMKQLRKEVDLSTFVVLLSSCQGREWHVYVHAIKHGFSSNSMVQNTLLDGLLKQGSAVEAQVFFNKMKVKNVISWTTVISGLTQLGHHSDAFIYFKSMCSTETKPNNFTFSSVLKACGSSIGLTQGRCVYACVIKHGIMDEFTKSSLLDMYAKCGALEDSRKLFDELTSKDVVSWNTMISAYAKHGYGLEAINLYKMMENQGIEPNHITFVSILSACSHCGLIDEGKGLFDAMISKHRVEPSMEHYACMVDLYGRAGMLVKAKDFIENMPFEADVSVWIVFLAACKLHGSVELAQVAKSHIMEMKDEDRPTSLIMSNMYSEAGNWDDAEKERMNMGIKEPAFSWA